MKKWSLLLVLLALGAKAEVVTDSFKVKINKSHQIALLNNGLAAFEERLEMLERAKKSIDVEYFIYELDKSGRVFTQALIKKAKEGVKVRMLLDYSMIKGTFTPFFAHEMEKFGIEVKYFNPSATINQFSGTYRNHRKVLLIDGVEAVTGGRNIADEYFDLREDFNFLDRDLHVRGEIVKSIEETFNTLWASEHSKKLSREKMPNREDSIYQRGEIGFDDQRFDADMDAYNKKLEKVREFITVPHKDEQAFREKGKENLALEYKGTCENMTFFSEYPIIGHKNRSQRVIKHEISDRFKQAKESVLFDSPYFIVDGDSKDALDTALKNNVKLELLTNSLNSTDAIYVYAVLDATIKPWIAKGLEAHIFKGNLPKNYPVFDESIEKARFGVHAKSFVIDSKDTIIGTYNFDPRSANLNTEMILTCDNNPELAKHVIADITARVDSSVHLDSNTTVNEVEFMNVGFMKRLTYLLVKLPANLFDYML
jgi:putative cardiolipin synthase